MTLWHITIGTYGARLHGDLRPTVDRKHNRPGEPFVTLDPERRNKNRSRMHGEPVLFTREQQVFVEEEVPRVCAGFGWTALACAVAPDHAHVLVQLSEAVHGKQARSLLKRRLTQALDAHWTCPKRPDGSSWWGEGGSTKAVRDEDYRVNVIRYIECQKTDRGS